MNPYAPRPTATWTTLRAALLPVRLLLVAVAVMTAAVLLPLPLSRVAIALPLALLLPGYAVLSAAFGRQQRHDLAAVLALSALLSLAIYALLGVVLYVITIPISEASVLIAADGLVIGLAAITVARTRAGTPPAAWPSPPPEPMAARRSPWSGARGGFLFAATIGVAIAALLVAMGLLPKPPAQQYTQFYLAGRWSHVSSVITTHPHQPLTVEVGLTNRTLHRQAYRIVPSLDNAPSWPAREVTVPSGHSWTGVVTGDVPASGCAHRLSIELRLKGRPGALDRLTLWVHGTPALPASCQAAKDTAAS